MILNDTIEKTNEQLLEDIAQLVKNKYVAYTVKNDNSIAIKFPYYTINLALSTEIDKRKVEVDN